MPTALAEIVDDLLAQCDADVEATRGQSREHARALERRAQFRAIHLDDKMLAVADCRAALTLRQSRRGLALPSLTNKARGWARKTRGPVSGLQIYFGAQAIAHYDEALSRTSRRAKLLAERAQAWAHLRQRAQAEADFDELRALKGETVSHWRAQARVFGQAGDADASAGAYRRALELGARQNRWRLDVPTCLRRANSTRVPRHERLAYLEIAVGQARHNPAPLIARANWKASNHCPEDEPSDIERAVALAPTNPEVYQARARLMWARNFHDDPQIFEAIIADYTRALRLRIAAGEVRATSKSLCARAAKVGAAQSEHPGNIEAIAIYNVAIESDPRRAMLYVRRAALLFRIFDDIYGHDGFEAQIQAAFDDNARALWLNPKLVTPRTALTKYIAQSLREKSAHEQLEGLLQARHKLSGKGLKRPLVDAIIAEVEQDLRAI